MEIVDEEIVIVGGGICGLATALALHRKGIKSVVLERSEKLRATGAVIIIRPNGWRALDQLGVASKLRETAIPIQSGTSISLNNGKKKEIPLGKGELRCLKRIDLIQNLAHKLPLDTIHFGCQVLSIQLDPITSYPILHLHDGRVVKAKVVIGCDGVNSVIANMIGLNPTKLLSTSVVRGFTNYESNHEFGNEFVLMSKGQVQLGHLPVTDKLVYWFLTRKWTSQDSIVSKDPVLIKQSTMQMMEGFPREALELIENSDLNSLHLTDLVRYRAPWELLCGNFRRGRVTVAGDAMHATGPFLAQGGSASLEDAVVLARCLAQKIDKVEEAFDQYVKERKMRVVWLSMETYLIGTMLDTSSILLKFITILLMAFLFRDPTGNTSYDCGRL